MRESSPQLSSDVYVLDEKLTPEAYSFEIDAYKLKGKAEEVKKAGHKVHFYARIPQLQEKQQKALQREIRARNESGTQAYIDEDIQLAKIDGLYILSNAKTSDGQLKLIQDIKPGENAGQKAVEIDDDYKIFIDPVTADVLGISTKTINTTEIQDEKSRAILRVVDQTRNSMGITRQNIEFALRNLASKRR